MTHRSPITTHVLDTARGKPASGIRLRLECFDDAHSQWQQLAEAYTNADGRAAELLPAGSLRIGTYRITFFTAEYFEQQHTATFYPAVSIEFRVAAADEHYHVPLLISPFGYSTYRGS